VSTAGPDFRIGQGWDLHRLVPGRPLVLGGITIPWEKGCLAHSDGDVLIHAVIDALLGAAGLEDIGTHFPPSDPRWKDADSRDLLRRVMDMIRERGFRAGNLDCTVILERPKLGPHKEAIRHSLAGLLEILPEACSVKAKTAEGTGAVGAGEAVEALAAVLLLSRKE